MKYLVIILTLTSSIALSQGFVKSTQYGLMEVKKGKLVQTGLTTIYGETLWIKFDYQLAEEFRITLAEKTKASDIYNIDNQKAKGQVIIDDQYISFFLFIRGTKQYYHSKFKKRT